MTADLSLKPFFLSQRDPVPESDRGPKLDPEHKPDRGPEHEQDDRGPGLAQDEHAVEPLFSYSTEELIVAAFEMIDTDGGGTLSREEFQAWFEQSDLMGLMSFKGRVDVLVWGRGREQWSWSWGLIMSNPNQLCS